MATMAEAEKLIELWKTLKAEEGKIRNVTIFLKHVGKGLPTEVIDARGPIWVVEDAQHAYAIPVSEISYISIFKA